jgi:hypothetical protein
MTKIEELKIELSKKSVEYTETENRTNREIIAGRWEEIKEELDSLLISKCCDAKILQTKIFGNGNGICENCRQEAEPKEPTSNCCDAEIWMEDANYHGKCKACGENCTP